MKHNFTDPVVLVPFGQPYRLTAGQIYISLPHACTFHLVIICPWLPLSRVSMGLTVSRKTAKNLAVRCKNERILTFSRKKILTVKKANHKIRSRDLLLSLMCYAFVCSGSEYYNRNRKCQKCLHNLSHGCRWAS